MCHLNAVAGAVLGLASIAAPAASSAFDATGNAAEAVLVLLVR